MKKFVQKVQDLTQKAEQIRQAIRQAPAQVAELRDVLTSTATQFHQIRQDVQAGVTDLKIVTDDKMAEALREIDESTDVFRRAGYVIDGVDIEFGLTPRLLVHMDKVDEVPVAAVRALIAGHDKKKICGSILSSLVRAEEIEEKIPLRHLSYREVTVEVGMLPCVRLCWRPTTHAPASVLGNVPPPLPQSQPPVLSAPSSSPMAAAPPSPGSTGGSSPFGSGSFFEQRTATPAPTRAPELGSIEASWPPPKPASTAPEAPSPAPTPTSAPQPVIKPRWGHESLDRFKKMPDLSK
jgi:hypothetical protein